MNLSEVKVKCTGVSIATINLGNEYSLTKEVKWLIEQAEKVERYEKALKFYANKEHYEVTENDLDPIVSYVHIVDMDEGDEARKALNYDK